MTHSFSPEVHLLAGKLVTIVSTTHLVVRRLIGVSQTWPNTWAPQEPTYK
jgi:hypothetical protein